MKDSTGNEDKNDIFDPEDGSFFRFRLSNKKLAIGCAVFFLLVLIVSAALDIYLRLSSAEGSLDFAGKDLEVNIGKGELHINGDENAEKLSYALTKSSKISLQEQEESLTLAVASGVLTLTLPCVEIPTVTIDAGNAAVMLYDIDAEELIIKSSASVDADKIGAEEISIISDGSLILTNSTAEKAFLKTSGSLTASESSFSFLKIEALDTDASILGGEISALEAESKNANVYFYPENGVREASAIGNLAAINFDGNEDVMLQSLSTDKKGGASVTFKSEQGVLEI